MAKKKVQRWTQERFEKDCEKQYGHNFGGWTIAGKVISGNKPVKMICPNGHVNYKKPSNIARCERIGCKECQQQETSLKGYMRISNVLESEEYTITTTPEEYADDYKKQKQKKTNLVKVKALCPHGEPFETSYTHFVYQRKRCKCEHKGKKRVVRKSINSIEELNKCLEETSSFQVTDKVYKGVAAEYNVICTVCGKQFKNIKGMVHNILYRGQTCGYCSGRACDTELFTKWINENRPGFELCKGQEYKNSDTPLVFRCLKHNETFLKTPSDFKDGQTGCKKCISEVLSTSSQQMHSQYDQTSPLTPLSMYLRGQLKQWTTDSLEAYKYKCAISGKGGALEVHHVYKPFNMLVKECVESLNLPIYENIGEYTEEQLSTITNKVLSEHKLGVPLTKELHKEYHSRYGYYEGVNYENFVEFVKDKCSQDYNKIIARLKQ
ncbi:hypothetical protein P9695_08830 [Weizmannia sp. CD-2023]|uniref:hypothetical protein n=1 Tax=Heyndrickxia TaxID=2837504 RepID=UPI002E1BAB5A|nr:hypothetical protein [Weizmannia sp. CD-2023]MED4899725.1 hypothetical protein [Weizmannia sp. CD-2023]